MLAGSNDEERRRSAAAIGDWNQRHPILVWLLITGFVVVATAWAGWRLALLWFAASSVVGVIARRLRRA